MSTTTSDRFRTFGDTFGKGAPAFLHIADTGVVFTNGDGQVTTGAWRAATPADLSSSVSISGGITASINAVAITGNPQVTISNGVVPISGIVQASLSSGPIVDALASGNILTTTSNILLSGISGALAGNLTDVANVSITGLNTGLVFTIQNKASSIATTYAPSGSAPYTGTTTFFGQALAANPNRLEMFIQNTHTGIPLLVNLGTSAAGPSSFSMILNPSTVQSWGGSSFGSSRYKGAVQVSGGAWVAWEI